MKKTVLIAFLTLSNLIFSQTKSTDSFKPTLKIGGRFMFDYEFLQAGDYSVNGTEFRRLRLDVKGDITKNIKYKIDFEFAKGTPQYRDVYLQYKLPKQLGSVKIGNFTEPTSMDYLTSSKHITFFERSMLSNTQPFKFNVGILYENYNLFNQGITLQVAHTYNDKEEQVFKNPNLENGSNLTARVTKTFLVNSKKHQLVHFGLNYEHRKNNTGTYSYNFKFENHLGDKFTVNPDGIFKHTNDLGFELAGTYKSFSFQSEYEISNIITNLNTYKTIGYYVSAGYFLTGEHKIYKKSFFRGVTPLKDTDHGGFGAIELVARYSVMDFTNYPFATPNDVIANTTLGFNLYLNKYSRLMYNFTSTNFNTFNLYNTHHLNGHLIRLQVNF